jgi:ElaB/YqjD/DUF883 family membrane-anchored ribosome-binding protein
MLSQWFDGQPNPNIRSISVEIRNYANIAREGVSRVITIADSLQRTGGSKGTFSGADVDLIMEVLKKVIADKQKATEELNKTIRDKLTKGVDKTPVTLEGVLDNQVKAYDAMVTINQPGGVTAQNAADFKKIVVKFNEVVETPEKMLRAVDKEELKKDPKKFFQELRKEASSALTLFQSAGYDLSQLGRNAYSSASRGLGGIRNSIRNRFSSKPNNGTQKRSFFGRTYNFLKNKTQKIRNRIWTPKKNVPSVASEPMFSGTSFAPGPQETNPMVTAGAARTRTRTRKNRRHH